MNNINPKKLLNSKWTVTQPSNKEKHFIITELKFNDEGEVIHCLLEAIISKRSQTIDWKVLKNELQWLQGWQ